MHMNLEQMTAMKATLSSVSDTLAIELVRLSNLRKQVTMALAEAEAVIREEIEAHMLPTPVIPDEVVPEELLPLAQAHDEPVKPKLPTVLVQQAIKKVKRAYNRKAPLKLVPKPAKGAVPPAAAVAPMVVPNGVKPTLKQALLAVMGTDVVNVDEALKRLQAKGWEPNARDPKGYLAHRLSQTKDLFERDSVMGRGFYRVRAGAVPPTMPGSGIKTASPKKKAAKKAAAAPIKKAAPAKTKKAAPVKKNGAAKKAVAKTDDDILAEMGIKPGAAISPFKA